MYKNNNGCKAQASWRYAEMLENELTVHAAGFVYVVKAPRTSTVFLKGVWTMECALSHPPLQL